MTTDARGHTPRAYTKSESREIFLNHIWYLIEFWNGVEERTRRSRLEGFAHSILSMLDGCSTELPGFKIIPDPHEDDEAYQRSHGNNWWMRDIDIGGGLHEHLYTEHRRSHRAEDQVEYLKSQNFMLRAELKKAGVDLPGYLKTDK